MTMYLSPLVDVNEIDLTTTIPAVSTSIGVIVVRDTWKGPELKVQLVNTIDELIEIFGRPEEAVDNEHGQSYEDLIAAVGFLQYGSNLYCTRVLPVSATFAGAYGTMDVLGASTSSSSSSVSSSSSSSSSSAKCLGIDCDDLNGCNEVFWIPVTGSYVDVDEGWLSDVDGKLFLGGNSWSSYSPDIIIYCISGNTSNVNIRVRDDNGPGSTTLTFNNVSGGILNISSLNERLSWMTVETIDGSQFNLKFELDPVPTPGT